MDRIDDLVTAPAAGTSRKRILIVGHERLLALGRQAGHEMSFMPDSEFAERYDKADPAYKGLKDGFAKMANTGFRLVLQTMEHDGIRVGLGGISGFWFSIGSLGSTIRRDAEEKTSQDLKWRKPTWHLVLIDTDEPFLHPSSWSRASEERGDDFPDLRGVAGLFPRGGILAFKVMAKPAGTRRLWRNDWKTFLSPYFTVEERVHDQGTYIVATRNANLYPGDDPAWFQPG